MMKLKQRIGLFSLSLVVSFILGGCGFSIPGAPQSRDVYLTILLPDVYMYAVPASVCTIDLFDVTYKDSAGVSHKLKMKAGMETEFSNVAMGPGEFSISGGTIYIRQTTGGCTKNPVSVPSIPTVSDVHKYKARSTVSMNTTSGACPSCQ